MNSTDSPTPDDGQNGKAKKPRASKKKPKESPPSKTPQDPVIPEPESRGRLGSDLQPKDTRYFLKPWIPYSILSLVIGRANVGKSTFLAWLAAQAGNVCILPGYEEEVERKTLPRMQHMGVKMNLVRFLDDRPYTLPRDKIRIANIMRSWEATLLIIDPIDSYMDEGMSENNGQDVRIMLESAFWIAKETEAAVVAVRHPGKDRKNLLVGSRSWRNVPKSIMELFTDGQEKPRYFIRHEKDSDGNDWPVVEYVLEGNPGKPRRFKLKGEIKDHLAEFGTDDNDPAGMEKVKLAGRILRHMMDTETEVFSEEYIARCSKEGIAPSAGYAARRKCGVFAVPSGSGAKWVMKRKEGPWPNWTDTEKH